MMRFSNDFLWGAASSAYQVEGAYDEDGKGPGIWDALSEGHIRHGENGNISTDHYHHYREDVAIMKQLGLKAYRFSISWPRVMPEEGKINEKGIAFYQDLVEELVCAGIEPMVTLYHWNLPMWIHEKGGWTWDGIPEVFAQYVKIVMDALSDKVRYWMTINEPSCFAGLGYITGTHAPFLQDRSAVVPVLRNVMLAHGRAVQTIRRFAKQEAKVGMALCGTVAQPKDDTQESLDAARWEMFGNDRVALFNSAWWADPMILGKLPAAIEGKISPEELKIIHQPLDFYGFNCYQAKCVEYPGMPRTAADWPITPDALYWMAKFSYERYGLPILITENGMANRDFVMSDGKVHDPQRTEYIRGYIRGLQKASSEGIPVMGYLYWSILDNFEWTDGYDTRFGLVYVDYPTGKRTIKDSAYAYADIIKNNGV